MLYRHLIDDCFEKRLGSHGISLARFDGLLTQLETPLEMLKRGKNLQASALLALGKRSDDLPAIETLAAEIRQRFNRVVVVGAGGSTMSGRALAALAPSPSLHFLDTVDPDAMAALLGSYGLHQTCFIVISKSGQTLETLAQCYVLIEHIRNKLGAAKVGEHMIAVTSAASNPLRQAAKDHGMRTLDYEAEIGGRFSVLALAGLLPAAIAGLDIKRLRHGARQVADEMENASRPLQCQPALGAALNAAAIEKGLNIGVMFAYGERLSGLCAWWRQSWAESLGKRGKGSTPVPAIGTTDQHSQLQLYLDGPKDKLFHFISLRRAGSGQRIPVPERGDVSIMRGKTTGDLMEAEQRATFETLKRSHCPVRRIEIESLAEEQMGALLMHFTLEIIFTAHLFGVNAFDQPAVEESKRLARDYLHRDSL